MEAPRLIVMKIGSSTLVDADGRLDHGYIDSLCTQIAALRERGIHVITVSSGAAAAGREVLGFETRPTDIPTLQACAATGQARLIESYERALAAHGLPCAQVLLTRRDVVDREGYLNARNTFERLLELGVVPIVNENDTVSVAEFTFGDNDMLGAIVSALVTADLYVILSDVDGLYTADPMADPSAELIRRVDHIDEGVFRIAGSPSTTFGTGGMFSKVSAARMMMAAGIPTFICQGRAEGILLECAEATARGTLFKHSGSNPHGNPRKLAGRLDPARGHHGDEGRVQGRRRRERRLLRRPAHRPRHRRLRCRGPRALQGPQARCHRALHGRRRGHPGHPPR